MQLSKLELLHLLLVLFSSIVIHGQEGEKTMAWYRYGAQQECYIDVIKYMSIGLSLQVDRDVISRMSIEEDVIAEPRNYGERKIIGLLVNNSNRPMEVSSQDGSLIMIMEAKDTTNTWRSLQFWLWSDCGNSYFNPLILKMSHFVAFQIPVFEGPIKTKMRLKVRIKKDYLIYSEEFNGQVSLKQLYGGHGLAEEYMANEDVYLERW